MEDTDEHQKYLQLGKDLYNRLDIEKEFVDRKHFLYFDG